MAEFQPVGSTGSLRQQGGDPSVHVVAGPELPGQVSDPETRDVGNSAAADPQSGNASSAQGAEAAEGDNKATDDKRRNEELAAFFDRIQTLEMKETEGTLNLPNNLFIMYLHFWIMFDKRERAWEDERGQPLSPKERRRLSKRTFSAPFWSLSIVTFVQVYFLMSFWWMRREGGEGNCENDIEKACEIWPLMILGTSAAFALSIWSELTQTVRLFLWLYYSNGEAKTSQTSGEHGNSSEPLFRLTPEMKQYCYGYCAFSFAYNVAFVCLGLVFLLGSNTNEDVFLNSAGLGFVAQLDDLAFEAFAPDAVKKDIQENMVVRTPLDSRFSAKLPGIKVQGWLVIIIIALVLAILNE